MRTEGAASLAVRGMLSEIPTSMGPDHESGRSETTQVK